MNNDNNNDQFDDNSINGDALPATAFGEDRSEHDDDTSFEDLDPSLNAHLEDEEDEEDEDEDEDEELGEIEDVSERRPFIKTPLGIALAAVGLGAVAMICAASFVSVSGGSADAIESPSVPAEANLGTFKLPSGVPGSELLTPHDAIIGQPSNLEPQASLEAIIPGKPQEHVAAEPVLAALPEKAPASNPELDELRERFDAFEKSNKSLMDSMINKSVSATSVDDRIKQVQSSFDAKFEAIEESQDSIGERLEALSADFLKFTQTTRRSNEGEMSSRAVKIPENSDPKAAGRTRLQGFQVVDVSTSGEMAIIRHIPGGRLFTVFKGEKLRTHLGRQVVTAVENGGRLILVDDKTYIDGEMVELPLVFAQPKAKKTSRLKKTEPVREAAPSFITGLSLNAIFEGGKAFGVSSQQGGFDSYRVNSNIKGYGVVKGLDHNGNLRVGDKLIRKAQ